MNLHTERNKKILGGALVIKGTRVPISRILFLLAKGKSVENITKINYPFLTVTQIKKAIEEAAEKID